MFTLKPHKYITAKGRAHLHKVIPYMRLRKGDEEVYLQAGKMYDRNGNDAKAPSWLAEEMAKCNEKRLAEVGFKLKEEPKKEEIPDLKISVDAQALIDEHKVDVSRIEGTGKNGRILKSDVQKVIDDGND